MDYRETKLFYSSSFFWSYICQKRVLDLLSLADLAHGIHVQLR